MGSLAREIPMIFVGFASNHKNDCYWMFDLETSYVHNTRDVIWLACMCYSIAMPTLEICNEPGVDVDSKLEEINHTLKAGENESILKGNADNNAFEHRKSYGTE